MLIKKYFIIGWLFIMGTVTHNLNGYTINVTNDSDCLILVEANSASFSGFSQLVDSGEIRSMDFGASCPWWIKISDFLKPSGKSPLPIELHYGDTPSEQCSDKTIKVTANAPTWDKVTQLHAHTEPWAHDGTRSLHGWKNDWSSPTPVFSQTYKPKL